MNQSRTTTTSQDIEFRIRVWIENNPQRADVGQRMLVQLERIRTEFAGQTADRLESLVSETLDRQIRIDKSRETGLDAARKLANSVQHLTESMSRCLLAAQKAQDSVDRTAIKLEQVRANTPQTFTFAAPKVKPSNDKLMN
ncbi:MAG: hypothetical protein JKY56_16995 [Kofleriaceae bacterium]|nr:hypothetical protein [Kofleriaceae bacterium]